MSLANGIWPHLRSVPPTQASHFSDRTRFSVSTVMVATTMSSVFVALFALLASSFRTRAAIQAEVLALRHQLAVYQKNAEIDFRNGPILQIIARLLVRSWDDGWDD